MRNGIREKFIFECTLLFIKASVWLVPTRSSLVSKHARIRRYTLLRVTIIENEIAGQVPIVRTTSPSKFTNYVPGLVRAGTLRLIHCFICLLRVYGNNKSIFICEHVLQLGYPRWSFRQLRALITFYLHVLYFPATVVLHMHLFWGVLCILSQWHKQSKCDDVMLKKVTSTWKLLISDRF